MDLCICSHQLLDEDAITVRAATNLITEEGQLMRPLHLLRILAGVILVGSWKFPCIRFLPSPIWLPLFLTLRPHLSPNSTILFPHFLIPNPLLFNTSTHSLCRRSYLLPLPRAIHLSLLGSSLLCNFSGAVGCSLVSFALHLVST